MTQDELAQKIGAIKQTVSKRECGIYSPTFNVLIEICNLLHTTPNELLLVDTKWLEWKEENIKKRVVLLIIWQTISISLKIYEQMQIYVHKTAIQKENYFI